MLLLELTERLTANFLYMMQQSIATLCEISFIKLEGCQLRYIKIIKHKQKQATNTFTPVGHFREMGLLYIKYYKLTTFPR